MTEPSFAIVRTRLLAYLLDCLPFAAYAFVYGAIGKRVIGTPAPEWTHDGWIVWLVTVATISLPVWLYFALLESSAWQATLAKRALGLRVETTEGARLSFGRALLRTAVKLLPWEVAHATLLLPIPIADAGADAALRKGFVLSTMLVGSWLITVILTKDHVAVHDLIAKTRVLLTPRAPPTSDRGAATAA